MGWVLLAGGLALAVGAAMKLRPGRPRAAPTLADPEAMERLRRLELSEQDEQLREATRAIRKSEERLEALLEHAEEVIVVLDAEGRIVYESAAAEHVLGFHPRERIGRSYLELIDPEQRDDVAARFMALARDGREFRTEVRVRHRDGTPRILRLCARNLLEHPAIGGIVVNLRDVSEERSLEERLVRAQKMEALGRLTSGIAHDFNNYLTTIRGSAQLALEDLPPASPVQAEISEIIRTTDRATSVVRQLLAFSRSEPVQPAAVDLNRLVAELGAMVRRLVGEDVNIDVRLGARAPAVLADPGRLQQVVMNLVVNARDAIAAGGRITIETRDGEAEAWLQERHLDPGDGHVMLVVADDGHGMDRATLDRIFEPFFTTKEPGKGTGLGLATVYGIVEQAGGRIDVWSEPGGGARFTIRLPRAAATPTEAVEATTVDPRKGAETVLLVEDEPGVRRLAARSLQRQGYTVLEAESGAEALLLLRGIEGPVHLLVSDVILPGMSARELIAEVRAARPAVRVIVTSGYPEEELADRADLPATDAFLPKPFTPGALALLVREVLDRAS